MQADHGQDSGPGKDEITWRQAAMQLGTRKGRPPKYTPARIEAILKLLAAGNTRMNCAALAGIGYTTLKTWCDRFSDFRAEMEKAEAFAEGMHVQNILSAAQAGNWTASAWWLERRRHGNWGRKDRVEVVQLVDRIAEQEHLSPEEREAVLRETERILEAARG